MSLLKLEPVDSRPVRRELANWAGGLSGLSGVLRAYIFGSYATGNQNLESDVDIAVIVEDGFDRRLLPRPLHGLIPVDFVVLPLSEFERRQHVGGVSASVRSEGIEIYPAWNWGPP